VIRVIITRKDEAKFSAVFSSQKEAEEWVKNHKSKGKDAQVITTPNKIEGAKLLEEVDGPMGVKLLKQELPAEYTVEYIDEALHDRENKMDSLRKERNHILCKTDWLFMSDVKVEQADRKKYIEYRQLLRDLPKRLGDYSEIKIETFSEWLRRKYPEEFMDGGKAKRLIKKFNAYLEE
jgi:uncharacterized protein YfcZ (UPF0381/DUF406 family)